MIFYLSFFGAVLIGLIMGLIGGGGTILAVPMLVYIMGINPVLATAYSLFIVGTTSAVGTVLNYRKGIVEIGTALRFAIPSVISIFFTRKFLMPAIPEIIFENGQLTVSKELAIMVIFAVVMLASSWSMLKREPIEPDTEERKSYLSVYIWLFLFGILIGIIGAGGGFMILPALVLIAKLPMKKAVGTALFMIAINSLTGFAGDIGNYPMDWTFLLSFTAIAITGIFTGIYFARYIPDNKLKKLFGYFVLLMAISILATELFFSW